MKGDALFNWLTTKLLSTQGQPDGSTCTALPHAPPPRGVVAQQAQTKPGFKLKALSSFFQYQSAFETGWCFQALGSKLGPDEALLRTLHYVVKARLWVLSVSVYRHGVFVLFIRHRSLKRNKHVATLEESAIHWLEAMHRLDAHAFVRENLRRVTSSTEIAAAPISALH